MTAKIYHNPRCSKSRATLELLHQAGRDVEIVEYLKAPPTVEELDDVCTLLGQEPQELVRTGEPRFTELNLSVSDDRSRADWLQLLVENPVLMERPIVIVNEKAVIGRPPESVLEFL